MIKKNLHFFFLFLLGRDILLLSNGYSNKTTGILLVLNLLCSFIVMIPLLFKTKKYNVYFIIFTLSFSMFYVNYSGYRDINKKLNRYIIFIYLIVLILELAFFIVIELKKNNKIKNGILIFLSFFIGLIFMKFLNDYYWEPKKIVYSTQVKGVKKSKEMMEIIKRMPAIKSSHIEENYKNSTLSYNDENGNLYYMHYNYKESLNPADIIIDISLETLVDNESLDNLVSKIQGYIKSAELEKNLIRIYIVTDRDSNVAIKIYDLKENEIKVVHEKKSPYIMGSSSLKNIFSLIIKVSKGIIPEN